MYWSLWGDSAAAAKPNEFSSGKRQNMSPKAEYQLNTENSNWQGALRFSPPGGKSAGSSEKKPQSRGSWTAEQGLVWEPADLHSVLSFSSKLLLPLNPILLHTETDGTCTERRGECKTHSGATDGESGAACCYQSLSVRWGWHLTSTPRSSPHRSPASALLPTGQQRGEVSKGACWWSAEWQIQRLLLHNWTVPY